MTTFNKTTLVAVLFSSMTASQKVKAVQDGRITDLNGMKDDDKVQIEARYLAPRQRETYLTAQQQQTYNSWKKEWSKAAAGNTHVSAQPQNDTGTGRRRQRGRGQKNGVDIPCGDGTLSVRQFGTQAAMDGYAKQVDERGIIAHGHSLGLTARDQKFTLIYLGGDIKDFAKAMGAITAQQMDDAIQYGCRNNGVKMRMAFYPLFCALNGGKLFNGVVQTKKAITDQADKQTVKNYVQNSTLFTDQGTVPGQRFNNVILGILPFTDGVRAILSWEKDGNCAFLPLPSGVKDNIRVSVVGDQMLLAAQANGDILYGITPDAQRAFLNHEGNGAWLQSEKIPGKIQDISLGFYNQVAKTHAVIITAQADGKNQNRLIPVTVSPAAKTPFLVDAKSAVDTDIKPVVRVKQSFLATVNHNGQDDTPVLSLLPRQSWPSNVDALITKLTPQQDAA